jgi:5-(carboxyamino)imidazole ribonucleotide synthase
MLALAGYRLGERFCFLDPAPDASAALVGRHIAAEYDDRSALDDMARSVNFATYEFENVPAESARYLSNFVPVRPTPDALEVAQNRLEEKRLFEKLSIPVARYEVASTDEELGAAIANIGGDAVVKTVTGGYDGKGQETHEVSGRGRPSLAALDADVVLVEKRVRFERELSMIAVRDQHGNLAFYPLVENRHQDGILRMSIAPAPGVPAALQELAQSYAAAILDSLAYIGVLTVELFETKDDLLANEIAPRVHNSGHSSIEGSDCSQFENHVRAITGVPLGSTAPKGSAVMFNFLSKLPNLAELLTIPGAHVHLYDKAPRPGRKLGHVTLVDVPPGVIEKVRELVT